MTRQRGSQFVVRQGCAWLVLVLLLATGGCGQRGQLSGKVRYKGKEVSAGRIVFLNDKDRQVGSASINKDGTYSATVPSGTLKLAVITPPATSLKTLPAAQKKTVMEGIKKMKKGTFNPLESEAADSIPDKPISVPQKYADPNSSGLTLEVLGGPQTYDIDIQ